LTRSALKEEGAGKSNVQVIKHYGDKQGCILYS
jgi:hypothetical protein